MGHHQITLNEEQELALEHLMTTWDVDARGEPLTKRTTMDRLITEGLATSMVAVEAMQQKLADIGAALPESMRAYLLEGLTPEQREKFQFFLRRDRRQDAEENPRGPGRNR